MYNSIKDKIISRIYGHGMGWVFSPNDFLQDFKRYEIDNAEMWQKIKQDTTSAAGWIYASINKLIEMEYKNE